MQFVPYLTQQKGVEIGNSLMLLGHQKARFARNCTIR